MSVTAPFPAADKGSHLMVSRDAVLIKPDGAVTWVVSGDKPMKAVPVPVGVITRQDTTFAVSPLTEEGKKLLVDGATVVIEGAERLRPGQAVRLMVENTPKKKFTALDTE